MTAPQEVSYMLRVRRAGDPKPSGIATQAIQAVPRIARLLALAIKFEQLIADGAVRDYAELARLGGVTRARMTQIMKLLQLAPDLQERILFLQEVSGLNERNVRPIVDELDWRKQRRMFQKITSRDGHGR